VQIVGLKGRPGEKVFGFVDVRDTFGTISQLPVGIINGLGDGPILLTTAGVHGCEYDGIEAATRIYRTAESESLKGTLIIITCMNLPAFRMRTQYEFPFDKKNLNWSFPGSPTGSSAEVIAEVVMREFLPKADYVVDCHGGDLGEVFCPMTICTKTDDPKVSEKSKELANAFGLDHSFYDDATSRVDTRDEPSFTTFERSWVTAANRAGVPAICAEAGCDGRCEERDVAVHVRGLQNVMKHLGMIPGPIERESLQSSTTYYRSIITVTAEATGVFSPLVAPAQDIRKGQPLAEIRDLKGDPVDHVRSPEEGVVLTIMTRRAVANGDTLFYLLKP
jgi:predicted deacylase